MTREERMEHTLIWILNQLQHAKSLAEFEGDLAHAKYLQTRINRIEWALLPTATELNQYQDKHITPLVSNSLK